MVPEKTTVDNNNESYYAGKGEYINLVVLTLEHHQAPFVLLSIGLIFGLMAFFLEICTQSSKENEHAQNNQRGEYEKNSWILQQI